uniref:Uncharacterized protein n=1 Tax=Arundo donax TaxID=35708 RepID=A0A0A9F9A1_ARUDO
MGSIFSTMTIKDLIIEMEKMYTIEKHPFSEFMCAEQPMHISMLIYEEQS